MSVFFCFPHPVAVSDFIISAAGPTGVVSEMIKASGGFSTSWMTDLINNIVKEDGIPDDWTKSDPLVCGSYIAIKLLEQPMKEHERVLERESDVRCQLITCSLVSCKEEAAVLCFVDLKKAFDRVPREVVGWALRNLGVDEWLIRTVMALDTEACTVVRTDAGLSKSFQVKVHLAEDLMVSGETYGCVRVFVILETLLIEMVERILLLQL